MDKRWSDVQIIEFMEKATGVLNGIVTRDDDGLPVTYMSTEDNGPVYQFIFQGNRMVHMKM